MTALPSVPLAEIARRSSQAGFTDRLRNGWYPSAPRDDNGHVQHDRHVISIVTSFERTLGDCADLIDNLMAERDRLRADVMVLSAVKAELMNELATYGKVRK